ncbi:MAG TPA: hypothetical protein VFI68_04045 [Anaerolineales bacterium]|nr:hypothetical protein [Anaerolineales bacterium]
MLNPFDPNKGAGSYVNLQKRIFQRVQSSEINNQIIEIIRKSFEDAIVAENVALSFTERKRLKSQILKLVWEDMIEKLGDKYES